MGEQTQALLERFQSQNREIEAFIEQCDAERWLGPTAEEQWTVAATVRHMVGGYPYMAGVLAGSDGPRISSLEALHELNATHAQAHETCTRAEALEVLLNGERKVVAAMNGLSDEQLEQPVELFGRLVPRRFAIQRALLDHGAGHLASVKATVG